MVDDATRPSSSMLDQALALHTLQPQEKVALLKEMRRVLRSGGTLHLADFDAPPTPRKGSALRSASYLFGPDSAKPHLDSRWSNMIEQAGFAGVRRVKSCSEILGHSGREPSCALGEAEEV